MPLAHAQYFQVDFQVSHSGFRGNLQNNLGICNGSIRRSSLPVHYQLSKHRQFGHAERIHIRGALIVSSAASRKRAFIRI